MDLAHPASMVAIEIDGGSHLSVKQKNRDRKKVEMLTTLGWLVLRFWNSQIESEIASVVKIINDVVAARTIGEPTEVQSGYVKTE